MIEESNKMVLNIKEKFVKANGELRGVVVSDLHFFQCSGFLKKCGLETGGREIRSGGHGRIQKC